jgi:hypothetical protein
MPAIAVITGSRRAMNISTWPRSDVKRAMKHLGPHRQAGLETRAQINPGYLIDQSVTVRARWTKG